MQILKKKFTAMSVFEVLIVLLISSMVAYGLNNFFQSSKTNIKIAHIEQNIDLSLVSDFDNTIQLEKWGCIIEKKNDKIKVNIEDQNLALKLECIKKNKQDIWSPVTICN